MMDLDLVVFWASLAMPCVNSRNRHILGSRLPIVHALAPGAAPAEAGPQKQWKSLAVFERWAAAQQSFSDLLRRVLGFRS